MTITVEEFMAFREELVDAERSHPEWRGKLSYCDGTSLRWVVPDTTGVITYWRLRNGTRGIALSLSARSLAGLPSLSSEQERVVSMWMEEWKSLKEGSDMSSMGNGSDRQTSLPEGTVYSRHLARLDCDIVTVAALQEVLDCDRRTIYAMIKDGRVPEPRRLGRRYEWDKDVLVRWAEGL